MNDPGRVLIVGAGPTGLGAAWRLRFHGFDDFQVLESRSSEGGLAASVKDDAGFTWDLGGHVQFSHYDVYDQVVDAAVGGEWLEHDREAWVKVGRAWVPYPFQYNPHRLPADAAREALDGLERCDRERRSDPAPHFGEWISRTFGDGIARLFMVPYNTKVWGFPLERLGTQWMGERVAVPDVERARRNVEASVDDVSWGPNNRFRFPLAGGTGAIWSGVARAVGRESFSFECPIESVDLADGLVRTKDRRRLPFDTLISTMPLDRLAAISNGLDPRIEQASRALCHSSVHIVGVGVRGPLPELLVGRCWMYFPDANSPYYRVTVFSNYSPNHVPAPGCWSLMAEVCESPHRSVDAAGLRAWTLSSLREDGLLPLDAEVVSWWHRREEYGYPTPTVERDELLDALLPTFERHSVYSRGRFGAWKYEVSNQDHSFMQGVEMIDRLLGQGDEVTLPRPELVNARGAGRRRGA